MNARAAVAVCRDALSILSEKERMRLVFVGFLVLSSSVSEVLGIASIIPFLTIATTPSAIMETPYLRWLYEMGKFSDPIDFIIVLGVGAIVILVVSTAVNVFAMWVVMRWTYMREHSIASRLFRHYLYKPYHFFINRHTTEFSKNIFTEIALVINGIFIPGLYLVTRAITAFIIIALLVVFNPKTTLVILAIFGGVYLAIFVSLNRLLSVWGEKRVKANESRFRNVAEAFGGIKDVLLYNKQNFFLKSFYIPSKTFAKLQSAQNIIGMLPRYCLELLAFGGVLVYMVVQLIMGRNISYIIPLMTVYVVAGYRLLPALQNIYANVTKIHFNRASLHHLADELKNNSQPPSFPVKSERKKSSFEKEAVLVDVDFRFDGSNELTLEKLNLVVKAGEKIGFVGETGCGKSTAVNLFVGLLSPTSGYLQVDGQKMTNDLMLEWQRKIGYVTQDIYLSGASIKQNIAFGFEDSEIDLDEVKRVCKTAQIHDFIENELLNGYDTYVGERGVRLSGGQIQRIGIARALHRKPRLLIMDEATNSLDSITEVKVFEQIYHTLHDVTIIIIAHRITILKDCDRIYLFGKGHIADVGSYEELLGRNIHFQRLVSKAETNREDNCAGIVG